MSKRLKVLASAYACEPNKGSEPGVGWNWVKQIARFHDVWVITRKNNQYPIEKVLKQTHISNVHWVYYDWPFWTRFWKKGQRGIHLYYYLWQIGAYFVGKRLHEQMGFDIIHHLTFGNYWIPSFLSILPAHFVWGPLGGAESPPKVFHDSFSPRGKAHEWSRYLARRMGEHDPFVRFCITRADIALAKSKETYERLKLLGAKRVQMYPESGIEKIERIKRSRQCKRSLNSFRLISVGNLLHLKGFHLAIEAFARFNRRFSASEYWLIGDGVERKSLERLVREINLTGKVRFWGRLPRQEVMEKMAECDLLVHPSLHDSGGWVCLEAMALGRPVICLDLGGPSIQVTREVGFKVPVETPEQVINGLTKALLELARDRTLLNHMGNAAQKRATQFFDWDTKGLEINSMYKEVVHKR